MVADFRLDMFYGVITGALRLRQVRRQEWDTWSQVNVRRITYLFTEISKKYEG